MKRSATAESLLPDVDLSIDHPVRFREPESKRIRLSSDESSFFSIAYNKKVQNPENLVPKLLNVNGSENCRLEVNDEINRRLVCEGNRIEEGEVECFLYFDPETNEFVVREVGENYIFGEARDPIEMELDDGGLEAEFEAAIRQSPSPPQQRVIPRTSYQKVASPRAVNGITSSNPKLVNGSSKARKPEPAAKVSPPKSVAKPVLREGPASKPAARVESLTQKPPAKKTPPKVSVAPKPAVAKAPPKPTPVVAPKSPVKPAPVAAAKPPSPKAPSPKAALPIDDGEDFNLMDLIGQDAESEPEKPSEADLFDFDEDFKEVKTDSDVEPESKAQPIVQATVKPVSPKRPLARKNPTAKRAAHSSSGSSSSSSSGSSSSGSDSSSSGTGSSSSGSSSSSDSDSDSDSNKRKAKQPVRKAPVPKALPAKSPSPDQASYIDEDDLFNNFDDHDSDKQDAFNYGPSNNAISDDEFKGGDPITNADLPTTDEDEPAPKSKPPPKEELNSSDYSSDNDQRYAKVDLALIEDETFDIV